MFLKYLDVIAVHFVTLVQYFLDVFKPNSITQSVCKNLL
jgi:hypothetical protein